MKKMIVLLFALIFTSTAHAQSVGCFVSYNSFPNCDTSQFECSVNNAANYNLYGTMIGRICDTYLFCLDSLTRTQRDFDALAGINATNNQLANNNYNAYLACNSSLSKTNSLAKRLRKACGSKCRRIK